MKKSIQLENRKLRDLIKTINQKEGWIKVFCNNSNRHEQVKLLVLKLLKSNGFEVYSECEFKRGGRCDVFGIFNGEGYVLEIMDSETDKKLDKKIEKYPHMPNLSIIRLRVNDFDLNEGTFKSDLLCIDLFNIHRFLSNGI